MLGYILKRLLLAIPTLFAVLSIVFVLARVLNRDAGRTDVLWRKDRQRA